MVTVLVVVVVVAVVVVMTVINTIGKVAVLKTSEVTIFAVQKPCSLLVYPFMTLCKRHTHIIYIYVYYVANLTLVSFLFRRRDM
jgi:hypothetical protein